MCTCFGCVWARLRYTAGMKFHQLFFAAAFASSTLAIAGCAGVTESASEGDEQEDVGTSEGELASRAKKFVGDYYWDAATSGAFVDFEELSLEANGSYAAKVEATLVNPGVRCIAFPCTLPEAGKWSTVKVDGKLKVRVAPKGGKPVRSYFASVSDDGLSLTRFKNTTTLVKKGSGASCAAMLCMQGTTCVEGPKGGECVPVPTCAATLCLQGTICKDTPSGAQCVPQSPCVKTGCSGEICADSDRASPCIYREEFACYAKAACERQTNGQCGFTKTAMLEACLANP